VSLWQVLHCSGPAWHSKCLTWETPAYRMSSWYQSRPPMKQPSRVTVTSPRQHPGRPLPNDNVFVKPVADPRWPQQCLSHTTFFSCEGSSSANISTPVPTLPRSFSAIPAATGSLAGPFPSILAKACGSPGGPRADASTSGPEPAAELVADVPRSSSSRLTA
jgi:hypothetical protein